MKQDDIKRNEKKVNLGYPNPSQWREFLLKINKLIAVGKGEICNKNREGDEIVSILLILRASHSLLDYCSIQQYVLGAQVILCLLSLFLSISLHDLLNGFVHTIMIKSI